MYLEEVWLFETWKLFSGEWTHRTETMARFNTGSTNECLPFGGADRSGNVPGTSLPPGSSTQNAFIPRVRPAGLSFLFKMALGVDVVRCNQVRQALGLVVVLLFVAGLLVLVGLVEWLEHYLESDLGYE